MVDFKKKLGKKAEKKTIDPTGIYESLDRASDKGPLRPVQEVVLKEWNSKRRSDRDVILKLHTGQGKTLIGLLILQSKLNEGKGPALYVCPNNFLIKQTCDQATQFGVAHSTIDGGLPDSFVNSESILIASVQTVFNGLTKFGLHERSQEVGALVLDDAHACIDTIKEQVSIRMSNDSSAYGELVSLFGSALEEQGQGTYADLIRNEYDAILPVPYWAWIEKSSEVAAILSRHREQQEIKFAWPLLKDMLQDCQCVVSGTGLEISPQLPPLQRFGSFDRASHRVFMSATVTDDSFLVKGLRLPSRVITEPLTYEKEKWSGEKMILLPSLIDESLNREAIVEVLAKPTTGRKYGTVALCPSFKVTQDWKAYGADVADTNSIERRIAALKNGSVDRTLVIANRYDGIDLPDNSCRILVLDSRPFSESILDRYMERCLGDSQAIGIRTARKIEQGIGRSVRGEKDYCVILLIGPELLKQIRTSTSRQLFSAQTRTQIEIGLEIAEDAKAEGKEPLAALASLINQCLRRDEGWKEFYVDRMDSMDETGPRHDRLEIFAMELRAEQKAEDGLFDEAAEVVQEIIDRHPMSDSEKGWYLQEMARLLYRSSKAQSNRHQVAAHRKNRYLLRPREGMVFQKITPLSQKRVDNVIARLSEFGSYEDLSLSVEEMLSRLAFGVEADTFEGALHQLGSFLGFASERPDAEWKEGPDNLWCLREGQFLLFEAKSQVLETRAEISKQESEQMNSSVAWFLKNYPNSSSRNLLVHPASRLGKSAAFLHEVDLLRKTNLDKLTASVRKFAGELRAVDLKDLSPGTVQKLLNSHHLGLDDLLQRYGERPRS